MHVPVISERSAQRQASAARGVVTRMAREHGEAVLRSGFKSTPAREAGARYDRALAKADAAENRLDAIRSQQPERHMRAWGEAS